jgi:hypothetical protein
MAWNSFRSFEAMAGEILECPCMTDRMASATSSEEISFSR